MAVPSCQTDGVRALKFVDHVGGEELGDNVRGVVLIACTTINMSPWPVTGMAGLVGSRTVSTSGVRICGLTATGTVIAHQLHMTVAAVGFRRIGLAGDRARAIWRIS